MSCTETGSYHFAFQDSGLSDFQTLLTYKILNNVNVAVIRQVKWKPDHFWLPSVAQKRRVPSRCSLMWTQLEAVSGEETASIYCRTRTIWTLNMFSHLELKLPLLYYEFQTYFRVFFSTLFWVVLLIDSKFHNERGWGWSVACMWPVIMVEEKQRVLVRLLQALRYSVTSAFKNETLVSSPLRVIGENKLIKISSDS